MIHLRIRVARSRSYLACEIQSATRDRVVFVDDSAGHSNDDYQETMDPLTATCPQCLATPLALAMIIAEQNRRLLAAIDRLVAALGR